MNASLDDIELQVSRLGGHAAIDWLNTVDWRLAPDRRSDRITSYLHLLRWCHEVGMLDAAESGALAELAASNPVQAAHEHTAAIELREDTYTALVEGKQPELLVNAYRNTLSRSSLQPVDGRWQWASDDLSLATPGDHIVCSIMKLFEHPKLARFHRCEDQHCGWVYLDVSPRGDRRWCSSADCGNRNRARAHYQRTKQQVS